eukprot:TRINITY_DN13493_c0_g1_i1.p1 TRINITY_DN13493_c0_g1~~TRINITY_DN13493_c0_g1_i1.p1  ORF type:complete len:158 (+),score=22.22 TRINITY_DN13493_c0_g1_i1:40-513(+)
MVRIALDDPLFATYCVSACIMILKVVSMSWLTVIRMMQESAGFRAPEDLRKTLLNPKPNAEQTKPNERVERVRRIQMNDLENVPFFLIGAFLWMLTEPSLFVAQCVMYGYVGSRLMHFMVYFTAQTHDMRATFWTIGSVLLIYMAGSTLYTALQYAF